MRAYIESISASFHVRLLAAASDVRTGAKPWRGAYRSSLRLHLLVGAVRIRGVDNSKLLILSLHLLLMKF